MQYYIVLVYARDGGFTTKSKFARDWATIIAAAAINGGITTQLSEDCWGNRWFITEFGLAHLKELENVIDFASIAD